MVALSNIRRSGLEREATLQIGVATRAVAGQRVSGDVHVVRPVKDGILLAVIDGSGHGAEATAAARAAANVLERYGEESVIRLVQRCHEALLNTRGAAMTLVSLHNAHQTFEWIGVGNVEAFHFHADGLPAASVLLRGGIVGFQLPSLSAHMAAISRGDVLVLATDGIRPDFSTGVKLDESPQKIATRLLAEHYRGTDDGLVLAARYTGGAD
jgi:serine phosphatase RsbU (regulator of sigma subunit)